MNRDIDSIIRKLLIKYPSFGSTISKLEFIENEEIKTAATDGKVVLYNPRFLESITDKQKVFLFAHEVCHVKFDHIFRSEGRNQKLWNIATDAIINAVLKQDGLEMIEGGVDIPEAEMFNAEDMYEKLLKERESSESEEQQDGQKQNQENGSGNQADVEENQNVGHDLWSKAIEERKKEEKENKEGNIGQEKVDERTEFDENRKERKRRLKDLSKELASQAAGKGMATETKNMSDIGIAKPLIDWRRLLKQATKYEEEWTRRNARMRNGYFRHRLEQIPIPESEILLDVSGSVSENLLRNFLRECKNILDTSRVKVGCFDTRFYGFTELKRPEEIDDMRFPIGGGTDFDVAVNAFSRRATNKIIFTDGEANMPQKEVRNVIWVVFGDRQINPKRRQSNKYTRRAIKKIISKI